MSGLRLSQSRVQTFGELPDLTGFLLKSDLGLTADAFSKLKPSPADCLAALEAAQPALEALTDWNTETIEACLRQVADDMGKKLRVVLPPLFVAVSGSARSLPLFDSMAILGRAVVRQRLKVATDVLKAALETADADS